MRPRALLISLAFFPGLLSGSEPVIGWHVRPADPRSGIVAADANLEFEAAALCWSAGREIGLRVRVPGGEWIAPALDDDITAPLDGRWATAIVHFGGAQQVLEYAFDAPAGIRDLKVTLFVPPEPAREVPGVAPAGISSLGIRSRTDWGCPDGQGSRWTPDYTTVTHAIVHHTAGPNDLTDWAAEVRNIWYYHTVSNEWGDIGYNWLIDPNGVIYEGRAGGAGSRGAHFSCRNTNTAGVAILGTYTSALPSEAALASLTRLLGEATALHGLDPNAFVLHVPSNLNLQQISAHRDGNAGYPTTTCTTTECPGGALYSYLGILRSTLASCERAAIVTTPERIAIAPGGATTLEVDVSGSGPFTYQWFGGAPGDTSAPMTGATSDALTVSPTAGASYWVRVANVCGAADSLAFIVTMGERNRGRAVRR